MTKAIKTTLKQDGDIPRKSVVYSNIRSSVIELKSRIGVELDSDDAIHYVEVLDVHGQLSKADKAR